MNLLYSNHDEIVAEIDRRLAKEIHQMDQEQDSRNKAAMVGWFMIVLLFAAYMSTM